MTGPRFVSGFPPCGTVLRWTDPAGIEIQATAETYRESAGLRVYRLRGDEGQQLTGVMDVDPDTGVLTVVISDPVGPAIRVNPEVIR